MRIDAGGPRESCKVIVKYKVECSPASSPVPQTLCYRAHGPSPWAWEYDYNCGTPLCEYMLMNHLRIPWVPQITRIPQFPRNCPN